MRTEPTGYFDREPKIRTQSQMEETLKARSRDAVGRNPKSLQWLAPVKNEDGSGHQHAAGALYVIRKTLSCEKWMYWAWHDRKLLGYSGDVEIARAHCEAHHLGAG